MPVAMHLHGANQSAVTGCSKTLKGLELEVSQRLN
jgi:hypothetical protein